MPGGHEQDPLYSLSIRNMVSHCIFLGDKGGHYYIQTNRSKRSFFPLLSSSRKTLGRRALILSEYVGMCSCPLGVP